MIIRIKKEIIEKEIEISLEEHKNQCISIKVNGKNIAYINDLDGGTFHFYPKLIRNADLKIRKHKDDD